MAGTRGCRCRAWLVLLALGSACGGDGEESVPVVPTLEEAEEILCWREARPVEVEDEVPPEVTCGADEDAFRCHGSWAARCRGGKLESLENCRVDGLACSPNPCRGSDCVGGCLTCAPGSARCELDGTLMRCREDGQGYEESRVCDGGASAQCDWRTGTCDDLCARAREERSYIGCEYWAVATSNSYLTTLRDAQGQRLFPELVEQGLVTPSGRMCDLFPFALVLTNAEGISATVTIENPSEPVRTVTVEPGEVVTVELPCRDRDDDPTALKASSALLGPPGDDKILSTRSRDASYHIRSDVPVTVYQFNPLEYEAFALDARVYSYTNDASLLLPVHALTGNYTVMSRPTFSLKDAERNGTNEFFLHHPGFVSITATAEGTTEVRIEANAHTRPSEDGALPPLAPGESTTVRLAHGETLQLVSAAPATCRGQVSETIGNVETTYCRNGNSYDLTGTRIRADGPVSVLAGHDCTYVPRDKAACDHLEEVMFPEETLGREALVSVAEPVTCETDIPIVARVMSTTDGNTVSFEPEVHESVTLDRGEFLELEVLEDVLISGDAPIMVGQFLVGQQYEEGNQRASNDLGDPAFSLVSPREQWRDAYTVLVPETLPNSFVNVVASRGALVTLDGKLLDGLAAIGDTGYVAARVALTAGAHQLSASSTFGITLYGYANFTSYMIPGGLDLTPINSPD